MTDHFQQRYLAHRERKVQMITMDLPACPPIPQVNPAARQSMAGRRSVRRFRTDPPSAIVLEDVFQLARHAPSSCNRQAITLTVTSGVRVASYLCGGWGWLHNAPTVLLLFADKSAYKSPVEITFMPWLDAGVMLSTLIYAATACGLGSCIVNPHMPPDCELLFRRLFNPKGMLFCGAVALGYPAITAEQPEKKPVEELVRVDGFD